MLREIAQILTEVCSLLTYAWAGIRVDQPFSAKSQDGHPTGPWHAPPGCPGRSSATTGGRTASKPSASASDTQA